MNPANSYKLLSSDNFDDFSEVMNSMQVSRDCFCFSHRVFPEDIELGFPAQRKMQELVKSSAVNGVIAYQNNEAKMWLGIEPANLLIGHDMYGEFLMDEANSTWVIHCITTKPETQDRRELCVGAVKFAIDFAKKNSAKKIICFPVSAAKVSELSISKRFAGTEHIYSSAGFERVKEASKYFDLWALELASSKPKFSVI